MAIAELLPIRAKKGIVFFGDAPLGDDKLAFEQRGFSVLSNTIDELQDAFHVVSRILAAASVSNHELQTLSYLAGLFAVVFTQRADKRLQFVPYFEQNVKRLLDHDCHVVIWNAPFGRSIVTDIIDRLDVPSMGLTPVEEKRLDESRLISEGNIRPPHVRVFDSGVTWRDIAQEIGRYPPGMAPRLDLKISAEHADGRKIEFSEGSNLLIRRAFSDCTEVDLVPMLDGRSGVDVYRAYAKRAAPHLGRWPLPYFVKIGRRNEIFDEFQNYEHHVHGYIPFHLGPHLDVQRCCLGSEEGIIVGNYVEESESLRDCASDGRGAPAIACLFTRTLQGWYRQAEPSKHPDSWEETHHLDLFPVGIPERRARRAKTLGATKSLTELRALFSGCESLPTLCGPIHGDLHATNVLVRATDAIVIDFAKHCRKPLVYDPASLEAGLLVEGFHNDKRELPAWLDSIRQLYDNVQLDCAMLRVHVKGSVNLVLPRACVKSAFTHVKWNGARVNTPQLWPSHY